MTKYVVMMTMIVEADNEYQARACGDDVLSTAEDFNPNILQSDVEGVFEDDEDD